jgi:EmrB/QacA subfamily drug resistance transporter
MIDVKTRRPLVVVAVIAAMFMIAVEATIVSTAMPQIVARLGGLDLYSWVFAAFLLTQTAMTVVFGKLSDLVGRKKVMLGGIAVFLVGSLLCGFAWSMPSMIAFRLIQGVGAGGVQPMAMTIVGDLYPPRERGKVQGYLASIWAISAVLGPLAGGLIIAHVSWAWVFWMNLPVGVLAALGFMRYLHEDVPKGGAGIDHLGAGLFILAIAALMADLTAAATANSAQILTLSLVAFIAMALFFWRDAKTPEPMISLALWSRRPIAAANAAALFSGMVMTGLTTFLPIYVQGVMGGTALAAGFALSVMVLGWPIGATLSTKLVLQIGLRPVMLLSAFLIPAGALVFAWLQPSTPVAVAGLGSLIFGFGMGLLSVASLMMVQEIVNWSERGAATSAMLFARSLGNTFGATAFGAVLNFWLAGAGAPGLASPERLRDLLNGGASDASTQALRSALEGALHATFLAMVVFAALTAVVVLLTPNVALPRRGEPAAAPRQAE